jgi:hypothetical protein
VTPQTRWRPNEQDLAVKMYEDEAIIINLANGIYYSTDKVGGYIWGLIAEQHSADEIVAAVTAQYDVSEAEARSDLERLVAQLVQEQLVQPSDGGPSPGGAPAPANGRLPYAPPKLEIYRDIGHLFALDPPMPGLRDVSWDADAGEAPREARR